LKPEALRRNDNNAELIVMAVNSDTSLRAAAQVAADAGQAVCSAFSDWVAEGMECEEDSGPASIYVTAHDIMKKCKRL
jgi:hypothetical protein